MSKPDAWMPLYIGDYLRDTTRLSTEQHGAYLLLIMDYWTNGPLPDDDAALAQVTRLQPAAWKKHRSALGRLFRIADGEWRHKRIDEEHEKAIKFVEKQKANGAKGGRPKKTQYESQNKPMGFDRGIPNETPSQPHPHTPNPEAIASGVHSTGVAPENENQLAPVARVCLGLKAMGYGDTNPHDPKLSALIDAGLTPDEILAAGSDGQGKGKGFRWVLATAEGRRRDAANVMPMPAHISETPGLGRLSAAGQATHEAAQRLLQTMEDQA